MVSEFRWYVFVNAYNWPYSYEPPAIYFVPSKKVAEMVKDWDEENASRLFFPIMEKEENIYKGIDGFKKMELQLK